MAILIRVFYRCHNSDPYVFVHPWNSYIAHIRDAQNLLYDADLPPSMQHAENSTVPGVQEFNKMLAQNHDAIYNEVMALVDNGYHGYAVADTDKVQYNEFHSQRGWRSYWLQLLGRDAGTSDSLPTLKHIIHNSDVKLFQIFISVFFPPTVDGEIESKGWNHVILPLHSGIFKSIYRYHYALEIPAGDTGMILNNIQFQWKERHGYIFDDTLVHSTWNFTGKRRMIILADFPRDLGWFKNMLKTYILMPLIRNTKYTREVMDRLGSLKTVDEVEIKPLFD